MGDTFGVVGIYMGVPIYMEVLGPMISLLSDHGSGCLPGVGLDLLIRCGKRPICPMWAIQ